jgi:Cu/Ag efflux pump CusA
MSQGASTPIEVTVAGKDMKQIEDYSNKLVSKLKKIDYLRDVQIAQPLKFPVVQITLDRLKIAQMGLSVSEISRSVTASTSSSRFSEKNQWLDEKASNTYQVQV